MYISTVHNTISIVNIMNYINATIRKFKELLRFGSTV